MESPFELTEALAEHALPVPALQEVEKQALTNRPDLKRIACEEAAQRESVSIAKSSFGPRVNAFAGWEMDNPTFLAGGGGNNWLGGIELQFDICARSGSHGGGRLVKRYTKRVVIANT